MPLFPSIFVPYRFAPCVESMSYLGTFFAFRMVLLFLTCDHGLDFSRQLITGM